MWKSQALLILLVLGVEFIVYHVALNIYTQAVTADMKARLSSYEKPLIHRIEQYRNLPFIFAQDPMMQNVLQLGSVSPLNERLVELAKRTQLKAIYLMTMDGDTIASSNCNVEGSFVGNNYGFLLTFEARLPKAWESIMELV